MQIKIYMCCHKAFDRIPPLCIPVQGGSAISNSVNGAIRDDIGDSISEKNREYCELTVQYYAWKNECADFYGFCHYRRFFCFDDSVSLPYLVFGKTTSERLGKYLSSPQKIEQLCEDNDIIIPRSEDMGISVSEHYNTSRFHHKEDLELFVEIISERAPFLVPFVNDYLSQNRQYFCNMFIMRREIFSKYCELLFPLLEEFDRRKTLHGSFQDDRTDGYLGERFVGIFVAYSRSKGYKIKEISRLDIDCSLKKRLLVKLFPPQTKRRFLLKRIANIMNK